MNLERRVVVGGDRKRGRNVLLSVPSRGVFSVPGRTVFRVSAPEKEGKACGCGTLPSGGV
jgi:hypothetical protein